ncbi:DUF4440 domain-containing protein [Pseudoalteromonas sp. SW0106-04]|uniref:nuclear transport factor 2 family protein n=1 Tax=Pseudoalteromonas sp. SW0106-04 TaxID=1702169 RepID=UPI0012F80D75|nr:nuclear transport factor 2 family protein [Pseudoalteromonas sp. SW0106-04]
MSKIKAQTLAQLIELERTLMSEEVRSNASRLNELLDERFIEVSADGRRFDKDNVLARLPKEQAKGRKPTFHNQDFEGRMLGADVAQLSYRGALRRIKGGQWHYSVRMSIWCLNSNQDWRLVYHQGTPCEAFQLSR